MRWLFWFFRSMLCKHVWKREEAAYTLSYSSLLYGSNKQDVIIVSATCTECGWHRSYRKFDY